MDTKESLPVFINCCSITNEENYDFLEKVLEDAAYQYRTNRNGMSVEIKLKGYYPSDFNEKLINHLNTENWKLVKDGYYYYPDKKICEENCCTKEPSFNYVSVTHPIYCELHKKQDMVKVECLKNISKFEFKIKEEVNKTKENKQVIQTETKTETKNKQNKSKFFCVIC
jgi:hypothetical protein